MRELFREFVVAKRLNDREHNQRMALAWHVAALSRAPKNKRLPSLESLLAKPAKQTVAQQKTKLLEIAGAFGLAVKSPARVP